MRTQRYGLLAITIGAVVAIVIALTGCGTDPTQRIADNTEQMVQSDQSQWSDANDAPPDYPTSTGDQRDAWLAFDAMTPADRAALCANFWEDSDQVIFDELRSYDLTTSEANALLNIMWAWC